MKQPSRLIFVVLILTTFYQCSSVRKISTEDVTFPEVLPDSTINISDILVSDSLVSDSPIVKTDVSNLVADST